MDPSKVVHLLLQGEVAIYTAHDHKEGAATSTMLVGLLLDGVDGPAQSMPVFLDVGQSLAHQSRGQEPLFSLTTGELAFR